MKLGNLVICGEWKCWALIQVTETFWFRQFLFSCMVWEFPQHSLLSFAFSSLHFLVGWLDTRHQPSLQLRTARVLPVHGLLALSLGGLNKLAQDLALPTSPSERALIGHSFLLAAVSCKSCRNFNHTHFIDLFESWKFKQIWEECRHTDKKMALNGLV